LKKQLISIGSVVERSIVLWTVCCVCFFNLHIERKKRMSSSIEGCSCCFSVQYYAESHAIIYVVDSSDGDRIEESKQAFGELTALCACVCGIQLERNKYAIVAVVIVAAGIITVM